MTQSLPHQVGNYIVTPFTGQTASGDYAACVSVRRGKHDRVFRFTPLFHSAAEATRYALRQGQHLVMHSQLG